MTDKNVPAQSEVTAGNGSTEQPERVAPPSELKSRAAVGDSNEAKEAMPILLPNRNLPALFGDEVLVFQSESGRACILRLDDRRLEVLVIGTKPCDAFLRRLARRHARYLTGNDLRELNECLTAQAEVSGDIRAVDYRIAPIDGGFEIDLGDGQYIRVRVTADGVSIITDGSETLFFRTSTMRALPVPAEFGDLSRLGRYLNLDLPDRILLIAWITYTLAHPKRPTTNFLILLLIGDQGVGKSFLCYIIQLLIDPSGIRHRSFPRTAQDLAISAQAAHILVYDNLGDDVPRGLSHIMCMSATGGAFTTRRLYSNDEEVVLSLHVALVLNGIAPSLSEPDLAQRSLPLRLRQLDDGERKDEEALAQEFEADRPYIFRGLLDLIAKILECLPTAEVTNPERMLGFSRWLAAMEMVDGVPTGVYQAQYSAALNDGMLESLESNPLATAIMELVNGNKDWWTGTPAELLEALDYTVNRRTLYSKDWPPNAIALSRRLQILKPALRRQGIDISWSRGRQRQINISLLGGAAHG
jgi:hypothetical protein